MAILLPFHRYFHPVKNVKHHSASEVITDVLMQLWVYNIFVSWMIKCHWVRFCCCCCFLFFLLSSQCHKAGNGVAHDNSAYTVGCLCHKAGNGVAHDNSTYTVGCLCHVFVSFLVWFVVVFRGHFMAQILFESTLIVDVIKLQIFLRLVRYHWRGNFSIISFVILASRKCKSSKCNFLSHNTQAVCTIVVYGFVFLKLLTDTWYWSFL